ncbi:MAG: FecR family protein [Prevotella sp.]
MKEDNAHNEQARLEALMKVMRSTTDEVSLSAEEEALMRDAASRRDLFLLASAERALTGRAPLPDVEAELDRVIAQAPQTPEGDDVPAAAQTKAGNGTAELSQADDGVGEAPKAHRRQAWTVLWSALAGAAAMLAILLGFQFWQQGTAGPSQNEVASASSSPLMVAETAQGQTMTLRLADGTSITLNENSRLTYPRTFRTGQRVVRLVGEALFKVKHDAAHPFIVETAKVSTRVLGTVFDVRAYEGAQARVALVEGSVMVTDHVGHSSRRIVPGEAAETSDNGGLAVSRVNTDMETAWSDDMVYYDDMPLQEVLDDLAQRYHLVVVFKAPELKTLHVNFATRRDASLDETLELLNSMGHFHVDRNASQLTVTLHNS